MIERLKFNNLKGYIIEIFFYQSDLIFLHHDHNVVILYCYLHCKEDRIRIKLFELNFIANNDLKILFANKNIGGKLYDKNLYQSCIG